MQEYAQAGTYRKIRPTRFETDLESIIVFSASRDGYYERMPLLAVYAVRYPTWLATTFETEKAQAARSVYHNRKRHLYLFCCNTPGGGVHRMCVTIRPPSIKRCF